jgi:hypothetical protein
VDDRRWHTRASARPPIALPPAVAGRVGERSAR